WEVESGREYATRARRHIAQDTKDHIILVFVRSGELKITQLGREVLLSGNTCGLYDLMVPYTYDHAIRTDVLQIKIPRHMLTSHVGNLNRFLGRTFSAHSGIGLVTADFLQSFAREAKNFSEETALSCGSRIVDVVALMLESEDHQLPIEHSSVQSALY